MTWALPDEILDLLAAHLTATRPALTVEAGSGRSTAVFARYSPRHYAYEHSARFATETRALLPPRSAASVVCAPLVDRRYGDDVYPWYDVTVPDGVEFALIDGPPGMRYGREAAGMEILPCLAPGGEIWLDDYARDHERACVERWARTFDLDVEPIAGGRLARVRLLGVDATV